MEIHDIIIFYKKVVNFVLFLFINFKEAVLSSRPHKDFSYRRKLLQAARV